MPERHGPRGRFGDKLVAGRAISAQCRHDARESRKHRKRLEAKDVPIVCTINHAGARFAATVRRASCGAEVFEVRSPRAAEDDESRTVRGAGIPLTPGNPSANQPLAQSSPSSFSGTRGHCPMKPLSTLLEQSSIQPIDERLLILRVVRPSMSLVRFDDQLNVCT
jgi:hypothetical protein